MSIKVRKIVQAQVKVALRGKCQVYVMDACTYGRGQGDEDEHGRLIDGTHLLLPTCLPANLPTQLPNKLTCSGSGVSSGLKDFSFFMNLI